jgi:hypothetical protein
MTSDRRNLLLCIVLFLLAAAATRPILEMGVDDDWSYAHIARTFASSGHVDYDGWATPILLPQLVWSALFIKLFGFSFFALRLSTMVLAVLLIPMLYRVCRNSGLAPSFAAFVVLLTALSPLVMPEAVSFMSDVPAFFLFAICFYSGVESWKAASTKACLAWGGVVALAGVLGGLDRQVYWLAPLLFLPTIAWIQRYRKAAVAGLGAAWLATVLVVMYSAAWFQAKPYALVEHNLDHWKHDAPRYLGMRMVHVGADLAITAGLILLPVLVGFAVPGFKMVSRGIAVVTLAFVLAGELVIVFPLHHKMPSIGNILSPYGIVPPGIMAIGPRPVILGPAIRDLLSLAVLLSCAGCGLALWRGRRSASALMWKDQATPALVLGFVFAGAYFALVLLHSADATAYDRYLIPLLPLVAVPLLRYYKMQIGPRVSGLSWAALTLFALYGIATTHDEFAAARARLTAAQTLERAGIPRAEITAGMEYDGWTQLEASGYLNDGQIANPPGAYRLLTCTDNEEGTGPDAVRLWYLGKMPVIRARYFVVLGRSPKLQDGPVAPVGYTTWLPPARRQVFTQKLPEGGYAGCN